MREIWKYIVSQFTVELTGIIGTETRIKSEKGNSKVIKNTNPTWKTNPYNVHKICLFTCHHNSPNHGMCFIQQHTAFLISVGIICCLALIIDNPFIQKHTQMHICFLGLKAYRECVAWPILFIHANRILPLFRMCVFLHQRKWFPKFKYAGWMYCTFNTLFCMHYQTCWGSYSWKI